MNTRPIDTKAITTWDNTGRQGGGAVRVPAPIAPTDAGRLALSFRARAVIYSIKEVGYPFILPSHASERRIVLTDPRASCTAPRTAIAAILFGLVSVFGSQSAAAQTAPSEVQRLVHKSWTFKDGAPEPSAFAQTADGYLWVGSPAGLFRFDGVRFELFRSPFGDSLRSTNISALLAADDGRRVRPRFRRLELPEEWQGHEFRLSTSSVTGFAQDKHGITWAGSNRRPSGSACGDSTALRGSTSARSGMCPIDPSRMSVSIGKASCGS